MQEEQTREERIKCAQREEEHEAQSGNQLVRKRLIETIETRMQTFHEHATLAELSFLEELLSGAESIRSVHRECAIADETLWMLGLDNREDMVFNPNVDAA